MTTPGWFAKAFRAISRRQIVATSEDVEQSRKFRSLGWAHYLEEDYESAKQNLRLACDHDLDSNLLLGHVYFNSGDYEAAENYYKAAIEKAALDENLQNGVAYYHCYLGKAYCRRKLFDEALRELEKANWPVSASDQKASFLDQLAAAYIDLYSSNPKCKPNLKAEILERASKASSEALCLKPKDGDLLNSLGVVHYYQGDNAASANKTEDAKSFLEKAKTRFESASRENAPTTRKAVFYLDLAFTYTFLARLSAGDDARLHQKNALENFRKGIEQDSSNPELFAGLAGLQTQTEQYGEAIKNYQKAIDLAREAGRDTADYLNQLGLAHDANGQTQEAIGKFSAAIAQRKEKSDPAWYANRGSAYLRTKQYDNAADSYGRAIDLARNADLDTTDYHNQLGIVYDEKGELDKAVLEYQEAINQQGKPEDPVLFSNLGNAYRRMNRWADAARELERAANLDSENADYWNSLGNAYYGNREYDKAVQQYDKAAGLAPKNAVYPRNLGNVYLDMSKPAEAAEACLKSIELDPQNWNSHYLLGLAYRRLNEFDKARAEYNRALELAPDTTPSTILRIRRSLGFLYQAFRHFDEAIPELEPVCSQSPDDVDVRLSLGVSYAGTTKPREALAQLQAAAKLAPNDGRISQGFLDAYALLGESVLHDLEWQLTVGHVLYNQAAYSEAAIRYTQAVTLAPNEADHQNLLGLSFYSAGAYQNAIKAFRKASELQPQNAVFHANLADALTYQGDYVTDIGVRNALYEQAAHEYRSASEIEPGNARYHHRLGMRHRQLEKLEQAAGELGTAVKLEPGNLLFRRDLASCLSEEGNFEQALKILQESPAAAESPEYLLELANALAALDRYAEAATVAERINVSEAAEKPLYDQFLLTLRQLASFPQIPERHAMFADANYRLSKYTIAIAEYRKAIALNPENPEFHKYLGNTFFKKNNYGEAALEWTKVLQRRPEDSLTINNLGTAYDNAGRYEEAMIQYRQAADLNKSNYVPLYNLGAANYRLGRIEAALLAFEQAANLQKDFAPTHYNLGNCHYRLGNSERAKQAWETAVGLNPNFSEALFNLAVLLWNAGQREDAKGKWQAALQLDRNFVAAEENLEAEKTGTEPDLEIRDLIRGR